MRKLIELDTVDPVENLKKVVSKNLQSRVSQKQDHMDTQQSFNISVSNTEIPTHEFFTSRRKNSSIETPRKATPHGIIMQQYES